MSTETVAGRKRKGASLAPLAPGKRPARASGGWASLPTDIVFLVLRRVLAGGDIVDYIAFRGVCFYWRACTPPPGDPTLRDPRLRPRDWVALCDGDAVRPDDACEIPFFNTRTARRIRLHLPELRRHRIVGFTDGLVILLHKSTSKVRVLHPFTRVAVDLPPLARVYREEVGRWKEHMFKMTAVVCGANSANSIAVVVTFVGNVVVTFVGNVVVAAEPDDTDWKLISRRRDVWSMLSLHGKVYAALSPSREIVQLYPPPLGDGDSQLVVIAQIPNMIGDHVRFCEPFLVESGGRMLVADRYPPAASELGVVGHWLYEVHLRSGGGGISKLTRVKSLGDRALFLNTDRCLSVSARNLPSLSGNSIYFYNMFVSSVVLHSLTTGLSEKFAEHCQIHNMVDRIRPSVRPFTNADHLLTYCHHLEWAQGLMFHEYHHIPESFKELLESIEANDSKLRIPTVRRQRRG
ncbi:uncharacterized protein [Lolium perenne]|uniref:uncharacterized protein n=1 Tax=Lolium perenne TaxID=4522 RepID=UPI0021EA534C